MLIEVRCKYCNRFLAEIDFNDLSDQDFSIRAKCNQCKKHNEVNIKHNSKKETLDCGT